MNLSEKSTISISLVITLIGGILWLSWIAFATHANGAAILELQNKNKDDSNFQKEVLQRLTRIEERISK